MARFNYKGSDVAFVIKLGLLLGPNVFLNGLKEKPKNLARLSTANPKLFAGVALEIPPIDLLERRGI